MESAAEVAVPGAGRLRDAPTAENRADAFRRTDDRAVAIGAAGPAVVPVVITIAGPGSGCSDDDDEDDEDDDGSAGDSAGWERGVVAFVAVPGVLMLPLPPGDARMRSNAVPSVTNTRITRRMWAVTAAARARADRMTQGMRDATALNSARSTVPRTPSVSAAAVVAVVVVIIIVSAPDRPRKSSLVPPFSEPLGRLDARARGALPRRAVSLRKTSMGARGGAAAIGVRAGTAEVMARRSIRRERGCVHMRSRRGEAPAMRPAVEIRPNVRRSTCPESSHETSACSAPGRGSDAGCSNTSRRFMAGTSDVGVSHTASVTVAPAWPV